MAPTTAGHPLKEVVVRVSRVALIRRSGADRPGGRQLRPAVGRTALLVGAVGPDVGRLRRPGHARGAPWRRRDGNRGRPGRCTRGLRPPRRAAQPGGGRRARRQPGHRRKSATDTPSCRRGRGGARPEHRDDDVDVSPMPSGSIKVNASRQASSPIGHRSRCPVRSGLANRCRRQSRTHDRQAYRSCSGADRA